MKAALVCGLVALVMFSIFSALLEKETACFRVPVERLSDEEANAYYDGRKLVNDNQRAWVDKLAEENK